MAGRNRPAKEPIGGVPTMDGGEGTALLLVKRIAKREKVTMVGPFIGGGRIRRCGHGVAAPTGCYLRRGPVAARWWCMAHEN
jgi:hypothetical protein